ncbi:TetR/AcrR family transcriptional regulator C-terminal domain-containing protein [Ferrimonas sp. SCSIO 43195]|nr:TetR/AcrR family transcriptional regulator C-terminal domain-containing protein [Ferrimonas sp. SCSIO 43195]
MSQILELCGGSKETLYRYFGNKKGLLQQVIQQQVEMTGVLFQFEAGSAESLEPKLIQFGKDYINMFYRQDFINMYRVMSDASREDVELAELFMAQGPRRLHSQLGEFLNDYAERGHIDIADSDIAAAQFLGLMRANFFHEALLGTAPPSQAVIADYVQQSVALFLCPQRAGQ